MKVLKVLIEQKVPMVMKCVPYNIFLKSLLPERLLLQSSGSILMTGVAFRLLKIQQSRRK
jgi:hypothetical protein